MKEVTIKLKVRLDENNIPEYIAWSSEDPPSDNKLTESKGFLLSLFDKESLETVKLDLWDKKMEVGEMNNFFFNTLKGLSESYYRATKNTKVANNLRRFAEYFGQETGVIPKPESYV